jgi:hypothetical protein
MIGLGGGAFQPRFAYLPPANHRFARISNALLPKKKTGGEVSLRRPSKNCNAGSGGA